MRCQNVGIGPSVPAKPITERSTHLPLIARFERAVAAASERAFRAMLRTTLLLVARFAASRLISGESRYRMMAACIDYRGPDARLT